MGFITDNAKKIEGEVLLFIDDMTNERKIKAGLISVHNSQLNSLSRKVREWTKEQIKTEQRIEGMI